MTSGLGEGIRKTLDRISREGIWVAKPELSEEEKEWGFYTKYKESWFFHSTSWYMRQGNGYDGVGCSLDGCIPECPFYPSRGRLRGSTVLSDNGTTRELD
ncbi:MAG: hypothetical protein ACRD5H_09220 [Nitrososphaerales archaeon]